MNNNIKTRKAVEAALKWAADQFSIGRYPYPTRIKEYLDENFPIELPPAPPVKEQTEEGKGKNMDWLREQVKGYRPGGMQNE